MSINANIACGISGTRSLATGVDNSARPTVRFAGGGSTKVSAGSLPAGSEVVFPRVALVAGAKTIDLTAVAGDINGATTSLNGLKPRAIYLKNRGANEMTFAKGASNGLDCLSGTWSQILRPGEERCINQMGVDTSLITAIGSGNKTIDVSGTGTQLFDIVVVVG